MNKTDHNYLNSLVRKAQEGSSNAFAELVAVVYRRHYGYLLYMLGDDDEVVTYLKKLYTYILRNISSISKPDLFMPWSLRLSLRLVEDKSGLSHMDEMVKTPAGIVSMLQLFRLPVAESQIMIMRFAQRLSVRTICNILNFERNEVFRCLNAGIRHLKMIPGQSSRKDQAVEETEKLNFSDSTSESPKSRSRKNKKPDVVVIQEILDDVFEKCGKRPNSVPIEALAAYAVYRKERFSLQKGILIAAMILFLMLPLLFIAPAFEVSAIPEGERGLPVVRIDVASGLPVWKVLADINRHSLPVYEAGAFEYTVEPVRNGTITIEVTLINRQSLKKEIEMEDVDSDSPELTGSEIEKDEVILTVHDDGIGIDFREIYAQDREGHIYYPLSYDEETGVIIFEYPDDEWDVYIPDHIGNRLHLSFIFE